MINLHQGALLFLLQLANSALPVGAYSYSEGLESLIDQGVINNKEKLCYWIEQELRYGMIRLEVGVMLEARENLDLDNLNSLKLWNQWLSATRETEELRQQSWQMGQSLLKLLIELQPHLGGIPEALESACNYAIAFGIAAAAWEIEPSAAVIGYLHSWATNLISVGVKLIPIGQTAGQQILYSLAELFMQVSEEILTVEVEQISTCTWGLALASMAHQNQYSRLFRS